MNKAQDEYDNQKSQLTDKVYDLSVYYCMHNDEYLDAVVKETDMIIEEIMKENSRRQIVPKK